MVLTISAIEHRHPYGPGVYQVSPDGQKTPSVWKVYREKPIPLIQEKPEPVGRPLYLVILYEFLRSVRFAL